MSENDNPTITIQGRTIDRQQVIDAAKKLKLSDGWRESPSQKFVVVLPNGDEVPPKALMSAAANISVSTFSGGADLNRKFARLGFEVRSK
tara:strand:- start:208 stop:477 length:270 start_codon:yes stop_codon:yes gene_type:complete